MILQIFVSLTVWFYFLQPNTSIPCKGNGKDERRQVRERVYVSSSTCKE